MRRTRTLGATLATVLIAVSCGGATDAPTTSASGGPTRPSDEAPTTIVEDATTIATADEDPCALVDGETVASVFAAASASGEPGIARNCSFSIVEGVAPSVEIFHYGSSSGWDGVKSGFVENRGGVTDVPGVGDEAYQPNDVGPYEIVVRSGDVIFSVAVQQGQGGPEVEAAILELAGAIAGS